MNFKLYLTNRSVSYRLITGSITYRPVCFRKQIKMLKQYVRVRWKRGKNIISGGNRICGKGVLTWHRKRGNGIG